MNIEVVHGTTTRIVVEGEIDFHSSHELGRTVEGLIGTGCLNLVIDLSNVEFMDSSGLSALLDAAKAVASRNGSFKLENVSPPILHVLRVTRLAECLDVEPVKLHVPETEAGADRATLESRCVEFHVASRSDAVALIRNKVIEFARRLPFTANELEDVKLAVGEASSNAVRYGHRHERREPIHVRCSFDGRALNIEIKDRGPGFDLAKVPEPSPELSEGGRGLYFMRMLMDEVDYSFEPDGTRVRLIKRASLGDA